MKALQLALMACLMVFAASAQEPAADLEKWEKAHPEEDLIYLKREHHIDIELKKGAPLIEEHFLNEVFYLTDKPARFSRMNFSYGAFCELDDLEAFSLVPEDGKYKKYESSYFREKDAYTPSIFADDERSVNFSFRNLEKGSKGQYSYTLKKEDPHFLGACFFITAQASVSEVFSIEVDEEIEVGWKSFNMDGLDVEFTETIEKGRKRYRWEVKNLEVLKYEEDVPGVAHWAPHIVPFIKSYTVKGEKTEVLGSVENLFAWYCTLADEVDRSEQSDLQLLCDSLVPDASISELEKVKTIFEWTKKNIKYVAVEKGMGGFIPRSGETVCNRRYGDCKDMASLMHEMGMLVGADIKMAWVGSRSKPYTYEEMPSPIVDDHMIGAYQHEGKWLFLDATDSYCTFARPSSFIQGKEALIRMDDKAFEVAAIPALTAEENKVRIQLDMNIEESLLLGKAVMTLEGYYVDHYRSVLTDMDEKERTDFYNDYFEKGNNKCSIKNVELFGLEEGDTLSIHYDFEIENYVVSVDEEIFVNLNLEKMYHDHLLDKERVLPRTFEYASLVEVESTLEVPEGYLLKSIPENSTMDFPDYAYSVQLQEKENKVQSNTQVEIGVLELKPDDFESWNEMIGSLRKIYRSSIVLERTSSPQKSQ